RGRGGLPASAVLLSQLLNRFLSRELRSVRHHSNVSHHSTILMFENMTVIDEITDLGKWDPNDHRRYRATAATPVANRTIACGPAIVEGKVVHQGSRLIVVLRRR